MFGIVLSALNSTLSFVFRSIIIKFGVMFALYFVVTSFVSFLSSVGVFPSANSISSAFNSLPSGVAYFLHMFAIDVGGPLIFTAYATRFVIRRIPFLN